MYMGSWVRVRLRDDQAIGEPHRQAVSPWDASRERGMVRRSDRYLADQYLRRERREGRAHAAWPEESDHKTPQLLGYGIMLRHLKHG